VSDGKKRCFFSPSPCRLLCFLSLTHFLSLFPPCCKLREKPLVDFLMLRRDYFLFFLAWVLVLVLLVGFFPRNRWVAPDLDLNIFDCGDATSSPTQSSPRPPHTRVNPSLCTDHSSSVKPPQVPLIKRDVSC